MKYNIKEVKEFAKTNIEFKKIYNNMEYKYMSLFQNFCATFVLLEMFDHTPDLNYKVPEEIYGFKGLKPSIKIKNKIIFQCFLTNVENIHEQLKTNIFNKKIEFIN